MVGAMVMVSGGQIQDESFLFCLYFFHLNKYIYI